MDSGLDTSDQNGQNVSYIFPEVNLNAYPQYLVVVLTVQIILYLKHYLLIVTLT